MKNTHMIAAVSLVLMAVATSTTMAADPTKPATAGQPTADTILKQMSKKLAGAKQFSFKGTREINASFAANRGLQARSEIEVTVQRPNRLVASSTSNDGVRRMMYFDGSHFTMLDGKENMYATVPLKVSLDDLPAQLAKVYGMVPPLADFVMSNPYKDLKYRTTSIACAGTGLAGTPQVPCHRLALLGTLADAELWIAVSDSLPRKLTATVKDGNGAGTDLTIEFTDWNLNAPVAKQAFAFNPPKDSRQIPMVTTEEMAAAMAKK